MVFLIYMILVILQCKGTATEVPDPCPSKIVDSIVADMCKSSSATEEINDGSNRVDSVVLRIMTQRDDCKCRVMIDNQKDTVVIGIRKYDGFIASAPVEAACGLAVDINHIPDMSTGIVIGPIVCLMSATFRHTPLFQQSYLQFKSRIINGNFTRGYCIRLQRDIKSDHSQVLRIDCDAPVITKQTTEKIQTSDAPQSSLKTMESVKSTTDSTTTVTTTTVQDQSIATTTDTTTGGSIVTSVKHQQITTTTDTTTGIEQTTYIIIGAGSGVALILLVVLVVVCLRRKSTQKAGTNGNVDDSHQHEESDDKLPNNVLYVPAGEFDINSSKCSTADVDTARSSNTRLSMEGNYSTVDEDMPKSFNKRLSIEEDYSTVDEDTRTSPNERVSVEGNYSTVKIDEHLQRNCSYPENSERGETKRKQKPTIKPKPKSSCITSEDNRSTDQSIKHISPPNDSDNVYAVVDKTSKNVPTTNGGKVEGTCQPDQTYAVVDKARKRKSNPDDTNKKKFEINSGNR